MSLTSLHVVYPKMPPSGNHIYVRGTILRQEARIYEAEFVQTVGESHRQEINRLNPDGIYALHLKFFFDNVLNRSYTPGGETKQGKPQSRYKGFDLSNRIKFLEDCIKRVVGIDDHRTFAVYVQKYHSPGDERVEILFAEVPPQHFGVPDA